MNKQPEITSQTRKKLIDAFWENYKVKDIKKITIADITKSAGYNRGTFYEYFVDIYDILNQFESDLLSRMSSSGDKKFSNTRPQSVAEFSSLTITLFEEYEDTIFILLGAKGDPKFKDKLKETFFGLLTKYHFFPNDVKNQDYIAAYSFSVITGMLTHWHESGKDIPAEEFLPMAQKLAFSGIYGYLTGDDLNLSIK